MGLFDKLKRGLQKTKDLLQTDVRDLFKAGGSADRIPARGILRTPHRTDMGVASAKAIVAELREKHLGRTVVIDEIWETVRAKLKSCCWGTGTACGTSITRSRRCNSPPRGRP